MSRQTERPPRRFSAVNPSINFEPWVESAVVLDVINILTGMPYASTA